MITLLPSPQNYLQWYDDVWLQNWFNYIVNLSQDSIFSSTASWQWNDFWTWADLVYNGVSFAWALVPLPEWVFPSTSLFPTRRKKFVNTWYNNGTSRTGFAKANFILNKKMDAGSNTWWTNLTVTIQTEQIVVNAGWSPSISWVATTCILKKVSTWGTITTLKTLSLVNTSTNGTTINYTYSDSTAIWSISAWDVLYIEYTISFNGGVHNNLGDSETVSIVTTGQNNLFASIP